MGPSTRAGHIHETAHASASAFPLHLTQLTHSHTISPSGPGYLMSMMASVWEANTLRVSSSRLSCSPITRRGGGQWKCAKHCGQGAAGWSACTALHGADDVRHMGAVLGVEWCCVGGMLRSKPCVGVARGSSEYAELVLALDDMAAVAWAAGGTHRLLEVHRRLHALAVSLPANGHAIICEDHGACLHNAGS